MAGALAAACYDSSEFYSAAGHSPKKAKRKIPEIIASLESHQMREHHRKLIRYSWDHLKFIEEQIVPLEDEIVLQIREAKREPQMELLQTTGGNRWLRSALVECAWAAASKNDCFLKEKFWRLVAKSKNHK